MTWLNRSFIFEWNRSSSSTVPSPNLRHHSTRNILKRCFIWSWLFVSSDTCGRIRIVVEKDLLEVFQLFDLDQIRTLSLSIFYWFGLTIFSDYQFSIVSSKFISNDIQHVNVVLQHVIRNLELTLVFISMKHPYIRLKWNALNCIEMIKWNNMKSLLYHMNKYFYNLCK